MMALNREYAPLLNVFLTLFAFTVGLAAIGIFIWLSSACCLWQFARRGQAEKLALRLRPPLPLEEKPYIDRILQLNAELDAGILSELSGDAPIKEFGQYVECVREAKALPFTFHNFKELHAAHLKITHALRQGERRRKEPR